MPQTHCDGLDSELQAYQCWQQLGRLQSERDDHSASAYSLARATIFLARFDWDAALQGVIEVGHELAAARQLSKAARAFGLAIRLGGGFQAYYQLGVSLGRMERMEQANLAFSAARHLQPSHAPTYRALALTESRPERAVEALRTALRLSPHFDEAEFDLGVSLQRISQPWWALAAYDNLLQRSPQHHSAHANRGTVLRELGRVSEAATAYSHALKIAPHFPEVYNNMAVLATGALQQPKLALEYVQAGRTLAPSSLNWATPAGLALTMLRRYSEAAAEFESGLHAQMSRREAFDSSPRADAVCYLTIARMRIADWRSSEVLLHEARNALERGRCAESWDPIYGLAAPLQPTLLLHLAHLSAKRRIAKAQAILHSSGTTNDGKDHVRTGAASDSRPIGGGPLRVGFMSADFRWHVMAFLTLGFVRECARGYTKHGGPGIAAKEAILRQELVSPVDVSTATSAVRRLKDLEVYAISLSPDDGTAWRARFVEAVDSSEDDPSAHPGEHRHSHFLDLSNVKDAGDAARRIAALGLHALVDLNGYTTNERAELLALRPAAVSMHAIGYPGTMGADFVPYMVLDRYAAPPVLHAALSEKIIFQPHCYQVNDHRSVLLRPRGEKHGSSRATGPVPTLANFNQLYKVSRTAGELWCGALLRLPRVRLLLLQQPAQGEPYLRAELASCGINKRWRVTFAPLLPDISKHLDRTADAELVVDTPEYNTHTTGSDALWAGTPLLSVPGGQMASRVGASLLRASGTLSGHVHALRGYADTAVLLM